MFIWLTNLTPDQWSLWDSILTVVLAVPAIGGLILGLLGKFGAFVGWVKRGFKPEPVAPIAMVDVTPKPEPQPDPFPLGPMIGLPTLRPNVKGRVKEAQELHEALQRNGDAAIVNAAGGVLAGQGGLGKTTLARYYADLYRKEYHGIVWANAETIGDLVGALHAVCPAIGEPTPEAPTPQMAKGLISRLEQTDKPWLLIYDNVPNQATIAELIPTQGSCVRLIVTTRERTGWDAFKLIEADVLAYASEDEPAVSLLMEEAGRSEDREGARELAEVLGGLPLALVVAGAIAKLSTQSWAQIGEDIQRVVMRKPKSGDYPDSVFGAVQLSYDKLSEDAKRVADLFAWWAPEELTAALITGAPHSPLWNAVVDNISEEIQDLAKSPSRVAEALEELEDCSLLRPDGVGAAQMHRMTAAALRAERENETAVKAAAALLAAVYPGGENNPAHSGNWPLCRVLTPHVRALWGSGQAPATDAMEYLLNQTAIFLGKIADFDGGVEMARAALELKQVRVPETDRAIATGHATLGTALQRLGDWDAAETELRRAVELGLAHHNGTLDLADWHNLLGGFLLDRGRAGVAGELEAALQEYQQAEAIIRQKARPRSHKLALTLNNLGAVRDTMGEKEAARDLYEEALDIWQEILPERDTRLGASLTNVGSMAVVLGQTVRAEALLRECLDIEKAAYAEAPRHPEIIITVRWLVSALLVLGRHDAARWAEAEALCRKFGLDFAERELIAARYPDPVDGPDTGV